MGAHLPHWKTKARTALALGLPNIARAASYRIGVRLGLNPVRKLRGVPPVGPFFTARAWTPVSSPAITDWAQHAHLFSYWPINLSSTPPDWFTNPLTGERVPSPGRAWWEIADFDPRVGDIKLIWELSRMDWVLAFAQRARQGDADALAKLNEWLASWCQANAPYLGPNWKCGQEASIRVMHLACAALILNQVQDAEPSLRDLIALHLQRIAPTIQYAMAQDNNHGTSEAAALFIGGLWLTALGDERGRKWEKQGRALLENRAARLIGQQGTFSQYSTNYHRVMLDTFSMAETWRIHLGAPSFSSEWQAKAKAAAHWLYTLTDESTGDAPNIGANDGARLLPLTNTDYRDHRPSVYLAMALFANERAYHSDGAYCHTLAWMNLPPPKGAALPPGSLQADDGGFLVLRQAMAMALLRYPRFNFRPSQADVLHVDLWVCGKARLRDGGTFSYNTDPQWIGYFGGVAGHNTVQFDQREQMPRLSRFLLGDWLRTERLTQLQTESAACTAGAGYRDAAGAAHYRHLLLTSTDLRVEDQISGFRNAAVLRWRLAPGQWEWVDGDAFPDAPAAVSSQRTLRNAGGDTVTVSAEMPITRCELTKGWESLHYLEKTEVPVLEVEVQQPGTLVTHYHWTT